jgi:hypothetical protein
MNFQEIMTNIYKIDSNDIIVDGNIEWNDFTEKDHPSELTKNKFIGNSLWDYITDPEKVHIYQIIMEKVRHSNKPIELPFRSDTKDMRQYMKLKIIPLPDNCLEFQSTLEREESKNIVTLLVADICKTGDQMLMCSWCHKLKLPDRWREIEEAIKILRLFEEKKIPQISHGICADCFDQVLEASRA